MRRLGERSVGRDVACVVLSLVYLVPLLWVVSTSLKSPRDVGSNSLLFQPTIQAYEAVIGSLGEPLFRSIIIALSTSISVVALAALAGYALTHIAGRLGRFVIGVGLALMILLQMVPQATTVIPVYGLLAQWGLIDTTLGLVLANTAFLLPLGVVLVRPFYSAGPRELEDAARIDGAGRMQVFRYIVLPLTMNGLLTVGLLSFMIGWGEFIYGVTFLNSSKLFPVSVVLSQQIGSLNADWNNLMAVATITSLPLVAIFLLGQSRLQQGLTVGALK